MIGLMARSRSSPRVIELEPTVPELVQYLQDALGVRLTALIAEVTDAELLREWAGGETRPDPDIERRLRDAFKIAELLLHEESPQAVRGWFLGMNPELDDRAPALVLADDPGLVATAARNFIATG
jgi:hypothetical protein